MINFLFFLFCVFLFGRMVISFLQIESEIEKNSLAVLVGMVLVSYIFFILFSFTPFIFSQKMLGLFCLVVISWGLFRFGRKGLNLPLLLSLVWGKFSQLHLSTYEWGVILVLLVIGLNNFLLNWYWPIVDWDALALYDFRGMVLAKEGTFDRGKELGYFFQYPPFTSILHGINHVFKIDQVKIWYSLIFGAYILLFYRLLRQHTTRFVALIGTLILTTTSTLMLHSRMAYTNLPYSLFLSLGYLYLISWFSQAKKNHLLIGAFFVASSTWVRSSEPFWFLGLILIVLGVIRHRKYIWWSFFACLGVIFFKYPWILYLDLLYATKVSNPVLNVLSLAGTTRFSSEEFLARCWGVGLFFFQILKGIIKPYLIALLITAWVAISGRQYLKMFYLVSLVIQILAIYAGILVFSFQFPDWSTIPDSAARMSMFLVPQFIFVIMLNDFWRINIATKSVSKIKQKINQRQEK